MDQINQKAKRIDCLCKAIELNEFLLDRARIYYGLGYERQLEHESTLYITRFIVSFYTIFGRILVRLLDVEAISKVENFEKSLKDLDSQDVGNYKLMFIDIILQFWLFRKLLNLLLVAIAILFSLLSYYHLKKDDIVSEIILILSTFTTIMMIQGIQNNRFYNQFFGSYLVSMETKNLLEFSKRLKAKIQDT